MCAGVGELRVDRAEATATRAIAGRIGILIKLCRPFLVDVPGTANPADAFTKHLDKTTFCIYMARLYNCDAARI